MKYLWLTFLLCLIGLTLQVQLADPPKSPFADGSLACLPLPPARARAIPPMLPAPILEHIPPIATPARVQATSIEIFDQQAAGGLMAETRQADNFDWGLPRSLPLDFPVSLAYAVEPTAVKPVPVNTPAPTPVPPPELKDVLKSEGQAWTPVFENWNSDTRLLSMAMKLSSQPADDATEKSSPGEMVFYPAPESTPVEMASLEPKRLIAPAAAYTPNLYLPDGAVDEEGAKLTLIKPNLRIYELPDEKSESSSHILRSGDQVRPLTRLRNAEGYDWIKIKYDGKDWWSQAEYFIRVDPRNRRHFPKGNLAVGEEKVDRDSALPTDYHPNDLVYVADKYTFGAKKVQLRKQAAAAFERMAKAADKERLNLRVFSGFRDFKYQKNLYLKAVSKNGPKQDGTAAPGYSEHQLGTTTDICNENRSTILSGKFAESPEGRWLHKHSEEYGFRKSYTRENSELVGYKPEPWHFRYIGIAQKSSSKDIAKQ